RGTAQRGIDVLAKALERIVAGRKVARINVKAQIDITKADADIAAVLYPSLQLAIAVAGRPPALGAGNLLSLRQREQLVAAMFERRQHPAHHLQLGNRPRTAHRSPQFSIIASFSRARVIAV